MASSGLPPVRWIAQVTTRPTPDHQSPSPNRRVCRRPLPFSLNGNRRLGGWVAFAGFRPTYQPRYLPARSTALGITFDSSDAQIGVRSSSRQSRKSESCMSVSRGCSTIPTP